MQQTRGRSLGWEDPLEEDLQYSCLGNSVDRGAWRAPVHGVPKSRKQLSVLTHVHTQSVALQRTDPLTTGSDLASPLVKAIRPRQVASCGVQLVGMNTEIFAKNV